MDIDGWEILSDDGFLDFNEDDNQIFLGKKNSDSESVFDNYFCTSPRSRNHHHERVVPIKLLHAVSEKNELVDMKMDSPKSCSRVMFPPLEDKGEEAMEIMKSPRMKVEKDDNGFNLWKWSLTGIGAICSLGVAAATICVLFYGSHHKSKLHHHHKIQFQIYTHDKRIKQVVEDARKLNEAIGAAAARDVPLSRAHITYGGYYDGL